MQFHELIAGRALQAAYAGVSLPLQHAFGTIEQRARAHAGAVIKAIGATLIHTLAERGEDRIVCIIDHPVHGRCILKISFPAHQSIKGLANLALAQWVQEHRPALFPQVLEANAIYTVEEMVEGSGFRQWIDNGFSAGPVTRFLEDHKSLSDHASLWPGPDTLLPAEIKTIMGHVVDKIMQQRRYHGRQAQAVALARLHSRRDRLSRLAQELVDLCATVPIPRRMMCGDMTTVNLIVQNDTSRFYNVDYEFMRPGHHGFDLAYLLAMLGRLPVDTRTFANFSSLCLAPQILGNEQQIHFFRTYAQMLLLLAGAVHGSDASISHG
ncbi:phosphotransferase [Croceicoccus sp. F390]|uniref:Phosphotransferase n=1 Tax=Croceicoccus esteveae TaxID=3075597 RepID=A0ABU2ZHW1_9SPHN|nr:phosphotransferase [Croceicoccus sp. F390]MDT0575174.1 phosphotransferase [Croceicoccus sp. F390]